MENFLLTILTILLTFLGSLFQTAVSDIKKITTYSPCSPPIRYQLGSVDKRFNIPEKTLLKDIQQATDIWKDAWGQETFIYDPEGTKSASTRIITINMVYDTRQTLNSQVKQQERSVKTNEKQVKTSVAEYENRIRDFNRRSQELSEKIKSLDIQDPDYRQKFDEVFKESQVLNQEAQSLNEVAASLNQSTTSYNSQVNKLNQTISEFNKALNQKPEEGLYSSSSDSIDIYLNISANELIHTLAHEFGHALDITHTSNPKSIMYPYTTALVQASQDDIAAVQEACRERTR